MKSANNIFKMAVCQMKATPDKSFNLKKAGQMIRAAADSGAEIIVLPEIFVCPYMKDFMLKEKEFVD